MRFFCIGLLLLVATSFSVAAQDAVYLIRHCEKELSGADPALTPEGRQRAADWAEMLQHVDLSAVITSDALRTQETGRIIVETLGLPANALPRDDTAGLVDVLEFDHDEDAVLIVGHAETIPQILEGLGVWKTSTSIKTNSPTCLLLLNPRQIPLCTSIC